MNIQELQDSLKKKIMDKATEIIEKRAEKLAAFIKYETTVTNTELAMNSEKHGYDFEFISESYADGIVISPTSASDSNISLSISIPSHVFKNARSEEVEFFKTYILANAIKRLKRES